MHVPGSRQGHVKGTVSAVVIQWVPLNAVNLLGEAEELLSPFGLFFMEPDTIRWKRICNFSEYSWQQPWSDMAVRLNGAQMKRQHYKLVCTTLKTQRDVLRWRTRNHTTDVSALHIRSFLLTLNSIFCIHNQSLARSIIYSTKISTPLSIEIQGVGIAVVSEEQKTNFKNNDVTRGNPTYSEKSLSLCDYGHKSNMGNPGIEQGLPWWGDGDEAPKTLVNAKTSLQPSPYKRDGSRNYNQECKRLLNVTRCCFYSFNIPTGRALKKIPSFIHPFLKLSA